MNFDYYEEPAGSWESSLTSFRENGVTVLRCRVPWGAHEPVKGMKDFSKASRLRLERLLVLAQAESLEVELILGFPAAKETFPSWTFAVDKKALVPSTLWTGMDEGYSLTAIPSWFDPFLRDSFLEFVDEVAVIAHLYKRPEGPVSKVTLDLGLFDFDLNAMDSSLFADRLGERYGDIDRLNVRYQTSFNSFSSASMGKGFRALCDRRPWLAAFDYQSCRREMLRLLDRQIRDRESLKPIASLLSVGTSSSSEMTSTRGELAVDSVMLQPGGSRCYPFLPGGNLTAMAVSAFRVGEYLTEHSSEKLDMNWLGVEGPERPFRSDCVVVVSGKYLAGSSMKALVDHAESGARILFPFGLPQYDECLERFDSHPLPKTFVSPAQRLDPSRFDWTQLEETIA